jgi:hypothetical protein
MVSCLRVIGQLMRTRVPYRTGHRADMTHATVNDRDLTVPRCHVRGGRAYRAAGRIASMQIIKVR